MRTVTIILIMLMINSFNFLSAENLAEPDTLYSRGKFAEAAAKYNSVIEKEGFSAELLYNLGNAYVKAGDIGNAVICYEKALKLNPSDSRIKNNLAYVNSKVADANRSNLKNKKLKVEADELTFFQKIKKYFTKNHSSNFWAVLGVVSFLLLIAGVSMYLFFSEVSVKKIGFFGSIIFLFFSVTFVSVALWTSSVAKSHDEGVVMAYKTSLLADPEIGASESSSPLSKGTKLYIIETEKDSEGKPTWYKVRLNSDYVGWIQAKDFVLI